MAGIQNTTVFSQGERLQASSAQDISEMQTDATDVGRINHTGNPEGVISANPSSLCHDPSTGDVYYKFSGTGNTGWVLISQPVPNKMMTMVDDFLAGVPGLGWDFSSLDAPIASRIGHPGLIQSQHPGGPPLSADGAYLGDISNFYTYIQTGSGILNVNYVINLNTLSLAPDDYIAFFGLTDTYVYSVAPTDPSGIQNGIWFSYTDGVNAGNWTLNSASAGVVTSVDSGVPATTDFVNLGFRVNANGTSIQFTIDNNPCGTISTNIPTINMVPFMEVNMNGANPGWIIDLFYLTYPLTSAR